MKALSVREKGDLARASDYSRVADRILFDAKPPKGAELPGGNGVAFDWRLLADVDPAIAYMLSGGLNAANIAEALAIARPAGIDVSSGVESAPGVKDPRLIEAFFGAVETARKSLAA
jgi:phosphoribosylanthranilate isomerase